MLNLFRFAGSMAVTTRVTRRLQETPAPDKLSTSEYFQQIFETPGRPKAKVSQCSQANKTSNSLQLQTSAAAAAAAAHLHA